MKRALLLLVLITTLAGWFWFIRDSFNAIPEDFRWRSDVRSVDNFYDPEAGRFKGEQFSDTKFYYEVVDRKDGQYDIENVFNVQTIDGKKIIEVRRIYHIDPKTGKHLGIEREGHLFAPPRGKNPEHIYWHVNYDQPITLEYQGTDRLHNHNVNKYKATFTVDQTEELSHLEGVPELYDMQVDVNLVVWFDDFTGRLIKYQDEAVVYYVNKDGKTLHPWNKFSNTVIDSSVQNHILAAKNMKRDYYVYKFMVPMMILWSLGSLIVYQVLISKKKKHEQEILSKLKV